MEASAAANSDGGDAQGQQAAPAAESQFADVLSQLAAGQAEIKGVLDSQPWREPEAPQEPETPQGLDLAGMFGAEQQQEYGGDYEEQERLQALQRLQDAIGGHVDQRVQQVQSQFTNELTSLRQELTARDFADEFPDIAGNEDAQKQLFGAVNAFVDANQHWTSDMKEQLKHDPNMWRLVLMASQAADAANAEDGAESPGAAHLEPGSGATPGGGGVNAQQVVVDALKRGQGNLGWMQ